MDLSHVYHPDPDEVLLGVRENLDRESAGALKDRLLDAEQLWRYFCRRDEMNAETHLAGSDPTDRPGSLEGRFARVRYSPITIASERLAGYLSRLYYGREADYRTAMVETGEGGVPVAVAYVDHKANPLDAEPSGS